MESRISSRDRGVSVTREPARESKPWGDETRKGSRANRGDGFRTSDTLGAQGATRSQRYERDRMRISAVYYIAAVTATAVAIASASPDQLVVDTASGKVRGVDEGTYSTFKGIPYGASTAGEGRWTAPKDPEPWEDVRDATKFGAICPQPKPVQDHFADFGEMLGVDMSDVGVYTIDEDCLFLNVYTPNVTGDLPVMVWIHGGEFIEGAGEHLPADRLVTEDVVVVAINYRLGFLGYFAHPDLEDTNFGLLDQVTVPAPPPPSAAR